MLIQLSFEIYCYILMRGIEIIPNCLNNQFDNQRPTFDKILFLRFSYTFFFKRIKNLILNWNIIVNQVWHHLQFTRLVDGDLGMSGTRSRTQRFNLLDNIETIGNLTENDVLTVQPGARNGGDEELRAVGVGTSIGHRQQTGLVMSLVEVLIGESSTVDGLSSSTIKVGEVTTLKHEVGNDSVEDRVGIAVALLTSSESSEVLSSLGNDVVVELESDSAESLA